MNDQWDNDALVDEQGVYSYDAMGADYYDEVNDVEFTESELDEMYSELDEFDDEA